MNHPEVSKKRSIKHVASDMDKDIILFSDKEPPFKKRRFMAKRDADYGHRRSKLSSIAFSASLSI